MIAAGGKAVAVAALGANDYSESSPAMLPDAKHFLVVVIDKKQHRRVELRSLTSSEARLVLGDVHAQQPVRAHPDGPVPAAGVHKAIMRGTE